LNRGFPTLKCWLRRLCSAHRRRVHGCPRFPAQTYFGIKEPSPLFFSLLSGPFSGRDPGQCSPCAQVSFAALFPRSFVPRQATFLLVVIPLVCLSKYLCCSHLTVVLADPPRHRAPKNFPPPTPFVVPGRVRQLPNFSLYFFFFPPRYLLAALWAVIFNSSTCFFCRLDRLVALTTC